MQEYFTVIALFAFVGSVCYLWGYAAGSKYTLDEVNKHIDMVLEARK